VTDRRLGDIQLLRGAGNAQMAGDRLKGADRIEVWQFAAHIDFPVMPVPVILISGESGQNALEILISNGDLTR